jgi:hypothetical protein
MVAIRAHQLHSAFTDFLHTLSKAHFHDPKDTRAFLLNNLDYISQGSSSGNADLFNTQIALLLNEVTASLFKEHFESLEHIISTHCNTAANDDAAEEEVASNFKNLQQLNVKHLEDVSHEFQLNYKHKIDAVSKHLKHSIQSVNTQQQMLARFLRSLMLKYASMIELVKKTNPQCLKQMTPPHLILLDLKNIQQTPM